MAYVNRNLNEARTRNALIAGTATTALGVLLVTALTFKVPHGLLVVYPPATNPTADPIPPVDPLPHPKPDTHPHPQPAGPTIRTYDPHPSDFGPFTLPPLDGGLHGSGGDVVVDPPKPPQQPFVSKARGLIGTPGNTIGTADYPSRSINLGEHGTTLATFTVGVNGQVTACNTDGQPSAALAKETCNIILRRFRFQPALDDEGRPFVQTKTQRVSWVLPDE